MLGGLLLVPFAVTSLSPVTASAAGKCGGVETAIISCNENSDKPTSVEQTGVWGLLNLIIKIMIAGVGVLALVGFVYGAVLYTSAGGNPEQVKKARTIINNVIIGVIAFGLMFTLLNFIVPGGVFNA